MKDEWRRGRGRLGFARAVSWVLLGAGLAGLAYLLLDRVSTGRL